MKLSNRTLAATAFALAISTSGVAAWARPVLSLNLSGMIVSKDAKGAEKTTPLANAAVTPGETIRYVLVMSNKGDTPALNVVPVGKIPTGTAYEVGSASMAGATRVEFSLNGGKSWAEHPTVTVHGPNGDMVKPADPGKYTNLRWIVAKPIPANGSLTYTYEVMVK